MNIVHDCLGSLFLASSPLIKASCKFRISDTREKIFSLGNNTWLVYSVGTIATNQVSPKARLSSPLTISSGQAIMVQPGCHIPTMYHIISTDNSTDVEIHSTWLDWRMTLAQLFNHHDSKQITQIVTQLGSTMTGSFHASELLQRLHELDKPFQSTHWLFSSPTAMIGMVPIFGFIIFALCKKCCAKPSPYTPDLPAPSAPELPPPNLQSNSGIQPTPMNFNKSAVPKTITIINS
jgi:hypothetical protein